MFGVLAERGISINMILTSETRISCLIDRKFHKTHYNIKKNINTILIFDEFCSGMLSAEIQINRIGRTDMQQILIVDDERRIREVFSQFLLFEGYKVFWASNVVDARELLITKKIDLVLLDINMPKINGQKLYEIIRQYYKGVKVIVSSVYSLDKQKQLIYKTAGYYDKSQGIEVLLAKIEQVLSDEPSEEDGFSGGRTLWNR